PDDVRGDAFGHFIVLCGYSDKEQTVAIADPLLDNPAHGSKYYRATVWRLLGAIFLGVGSDDGNLLLIRPVDWQQRLPKQLQQPRPAPGRKPGRATAPARSCC